MGIRVYESAPERSYDLVILCHVLEHVRNAEDFLLSLKDNINPNGSLYIEVPDAVTFRRQPPEHDEFNSCHIVFYNPENLIHLLKKCSFHVKHLTVKHYADRDLSRILCIATNQP